jgi:3-phenylpropionate/trans-cinnamate dioxygenase ferredoxin reductase subunit
MPDLSPVKMTSSTHIVVVGGGQAAAQTIASLRLHGADARITLVGNEDYPPYQRPPLSKAYLKGEMALERLQLKSAAWYGDNDVTLRLGTTAVAVDCQRRLVRLDDNDTLAYDKLVLATGSTPRRLPVAGVTLGGVLYLRDIDHVKALREAAAAGRSVAVVGGGYIGLEAAASLRQMGLEVTVIEMAERVLERVTSPMISEFFEALHKEHGVRVVTDARVARFEGDANRLTRVVLDDGAKIDADIALIGIGIEPNDALARTGGIECDNGIVVDRDARTSDGDVYAVGDCAHRPLVHYGRSARLESVHNAIEQGKLAAASIAGKPRPKEDCPWFWSEQYDLRLQIAGLSEGYDEVVVRGDPATKRFAAFYLKNGVLIAVDAVNSPKEFMSAKPLIAAATRCDAAQLADPLVALKTLAVKND